MWPATLGGASIEGNMVHVSISMEADEVQQRFGQIAASLLGQRLGTLVKAARYLPVARRGIRIPAAADEVSAGRGRDAARPHAPLLTRSTHTSVNWNWDEF